MGYEWLALGAAFLWAIASLLSVTPARHLGTFATVDGEWVAPPLFLRRWHF